MHGRQSDIEKTEWSHRRLPDALASMDKELHRRSRELLPDFDEEIRNFRRKSEELFESMSRGNSHSTSSRGHRVKSGNEMLPDGTLIHKIVFDIHGYLENEVNVGISGERTLKVSGEAEVDEDRHQKMQFQEQVTLPPNCVADRMTYTVANNLLTVCVPLNPPSYSVNSRSSTSSSPRPASPVVRSHSPNEENFKKVTIYQREIALNVNGYCYAPGEVTIRTEPKKLIINAKSVKENSVHEFKEEFSLPPNVDRSRMTVSLDTKSSQLVVEAPLVSAECNNKQLTSLHIRHDYL